MGANVTVMQIIHSLGAQALNRTLFTFAFIHLADVFIQTDLQLIMSLLTVCGANRTENYFLLNVYSILYFLITLPCTLKALRKLLC